MPSTHPEESAPFQLVGQDIYEASLGVAEEKTSAERARRLLLGEPVSERLATHENLNKMRALALLSSDALSSVAYGPEASLAVLIAAGAAALSANLGIGLVTAALMLIVGYSYRQTIYAYPSGGGSYIVARDNLGVLPGLVAAAALLIDYVLTVSVSVASGIDAIAAAIPALVPAKLAIDLAAIVLIVIINLRGLHAAGTIFAFPTYFFVTSFGLTIVAGIVQAIVHGGLTAAVPPPPITATSPLTPLLILTAFSSGCSAMTGVEAISNGVPAFAGDTTADKSRNAAQTLTIMIVLLITFFLGTTYMAWRVGAVPYPSGDPTVTAQIARFAYSGTFGWLFYVVQTATLLILVFAANTSFADFPRLSAILARDSFLPVLFEFRGERDAFSTGIIVLGIVSIVVLLIFRGNVVALINLYALGVFTAFTLSQSGMVIHWLRRRQETGWQGRLVANSAGAIATGIVSLIIAFSKFGRGAWVVVVLAPLMVLGFLAIHAYYHRPKHLRLMYKALPKADVAFVPILSHQPVPPSGPPHQPTNGRLTPVPSSLREMPAAWNWQWPEVLSEELAYAARIAPEVWILHVVEDRQEANDFCAAWNVYKQSQREPLLPHIRVEALLSPYRAVVLPVTQFLEWQQQHEFAGKRVAVVLPREEHQAWWEWPLQRGAATRLRHHLQGQQSTLQVIDLPYTL